MKKITLAIAVLGILSLASCKKDYTCECTISGSGLSATVSQNINETKKKAKEKCEAENYSETIDGETTTATCKIK